MRRFQDAIENYNLAIKYDPNYVQAYYNKGMTLEKLGKHQEAKKNFNLAVKYKPNLIEEYEKIIIGLRKLGNNRIADAFEQKLKILKDNL
ncbi:tetratricopeptide repeat protein [Candidatus Tisiphia endosymbiont of Oplodontha viridula]|uniref:tetratricopeptide repeat protein n=1 Tax=Candidatus Tisiphia endosymbiont of Oplodontha viridula TaxID=3077925 RepID=UPI0035C92FDD